MTRCRTSVEVSLRRSKLKWFAFVTRSLARLNIASLLALDCALPGFNYHVGMDLELAGLAVVNLIFFVAVKVLRKRQLAGRANAKGQRERVVYLAVAVNYIM